MENKVGYTIIGLLWLILANIAHIEVVVIIANIGAIVTFTYIFFL